MADKTLAEQIAEEEKALLELRVEALSPRQKQFVHEYLIDLNGTQAAIRAGYSAHTAGEAAPRLLADVRIAHAVERGKAQRLSRVNMTQDTVLHEMSLLANSRLDHYYIDDEGQVRLTEGAPDGAMAAVQSIKRRTKVFTDKEGNTEKTYDVEIRLWDKPNPLKLMGKHVGLNFSDRVEVTGKDGGPVISQIIREVIDVAS